MIFDFFEEMPIPLIPNNMEWVTRDQLLASLTSGIKRELLPLFSNTLGPLLCKSVCAVQLEPDLTLNVIRALGSLDRHHLPAEALDATHSIAYFDLNNVPELQHIIHHSTSGTDSPELIGSLVDFLSGAGYALGLSLVSPDANRWLCLKADFEDLESEHIKAKDAINWLSNTSRHIAWQLSEFKTKALAEEAIRRLEHLPPQMFDNSANYWDDIRGFSEDVDSLPPFMAEAVRDAVGHVIGNLNPDGRLAFAMAQGSDDWLLSQLEDPTNEFHTESLEFDSALLVEEIFEIVIDRACKSLDLKSYPITLNEARLTCQRMISGDEDLLGPDVGPRLIEVAKTYPDLDVLEKAVDVYSAAAVQAANSVLNSL